MSFKRTKNLILGSILSFVFILLSFLVFIVVKSDFLDIKAGRIDYLLFFKDLVFIAVWLFLIPIVIFLFKGEKHKGSQPSAGK